MLRMLLIIALSGSCFHAILAQEPPSDPAAEIAAEAEKRKLDAKIDRLVKELNDDSQDIRTGAEKELIELGERVLDRLPASEAAVSIEQRARLDTVRRTVELNAVEAFTKPTLITLKGEVKLSEAVAAIAKQSGNKVLDFRERFNQETEDLKVTLDWEKKPFWEAADALFDAAELDIYAFSDEPDVLPFVKRGEGVRPRAERGYYAGLFRWEAKSVSATRDLADPTAGGLRIETQLSWEPRVKPIVINVPLADLKALNDAGEPLEIDGEGELEIPVESSNAAIQVDFSLALPERSVKAVSSLQGKISALVPGRPETFEFTDLRKAKNVAKQKAGVTVTLEHCRKNDEAEEIRIRVRYDRAANALDSHRGWIDRNEAYLVDGAGTKIESGGLERWLADDSEVGIAYLFDLQDVDLSKCKFVYRTPAAIYSVPGKFELKNIPLP